jgi:hypothetical protein
MDALSIPTGTIARVRAHRFDERAIVIRPAAHSSSSGLHCDAIGGAASLPATCRFPQQFQDLARIDPLSSTGSHSAASWQCNRSARQAQG